MANYLISNGTEIVNYIVAGSKEIAEQVTGLEAIEAFDIDGRPVSIGWTLVEGVWTPPYTPEAPVDIIEP